MSVRTTCPYCGVGCGLLVSADGSVSGDPKHPANFGRLCSKGAALGETLSPTGRLLQPAIAGRSASWDEALDLIAARFAEMIDCHGPDAVAFYVSGQLLTEDYYVANKLMKGFIGSANIDSNSRLCMASSVSGHIRAFGEDIVPGCYEDIEEADLAVLVGSNTAWCHPVLFQRLAAAKKTRGTRVVVIDPRRTETCDIADLHLPLRPGSDVALFSGLLRYLADRDACDIGWMTRYTTGFDAALACAPSLAEAATITDSPIADLAAFYDWFAVTDRTVTLYSQGVNQSAAGTDKVNAILNCHLATGRLGRPGMGPFSLTGQPNAMGGREVGGLANQLASHMGFDDPADIDRVRRFWRAPYIAQHPGLKAVDLFEAVSAGSIKAIWILGTNPAASLPRAARVRAGLASCPFVVVSDCWETDTTRLAHIVLPAAGWGEKDGTVTNSERRISRQRVFRSPPGEARPDWWMLCEVARRMGWREAFAYRGCADIFREHAALSAFENEGTGRRIFDIGELVTLSDTEYEKLEPLQWPAPGRSVKVSGSARLFAEGGPFSTENGRARFIPTRWKSKAELPDREWPLVLNTGRVRDQWHTMTRTGRVPRLMMHQEEPFLTMHPDDASAYGLTEGEFARIESRHGATVMRVRLSGEQRRGEVFVPMHWTDCFASAGPINRLVSAAKDPISGQPELKATAAKVSPSPSPWWGLLLTTRPELAAKTKLHWSRVPLERGHAFALAGTGELPRGDALDNWVTKLFAAASREEFITYVDARRGVYRYARIMDSRLDCCLFLAPRRTLLPDRMALAPLLGAAVADDARIALLAGRALDGISSPVAGRIVCACFAVGVDMLQRAIADQRMTSIGEIGAALRAGTNCGSCIPELNAVLREGQPEMSTPA